MRDRNFAVFAGLIIMVGLVLVLFVGIGQVTKEPEGVYDWGEVVSIRYYGTKYGTATEVQTTKRMFALDGAISVPVGTKAEYVDYGVWGTKVRFSRDGFEHSFAM